MASSYQQRDTQPFTWFGRMPVYATTVLVALAVVGMTLTVFLESSGRGWEILQFNPVAFWKHWGLWRILTHPFVEMPGFFYVFGLFMLYSFGVGVETHLGRRVLTKLVLVLCIAPALASTAWWMAGNVVPIAGPIPLFVGMFIAYATLYPNVEFWNWIPMKWVAFAGIFFTALSYFPRNRWDELSIFLFMCGMAHLYTRYEMGHWKLPGIRASFRFSISRKPKFRVLPKPMPDEPSWQPRYVSKDEDVDPILDKIAKSGMASLTEKERAILEKAREALLKKDIS